MTGYQQEYDIWSPATRLTVDMQNQISAKHDLTEPQAREVGNIIHTLTFYRAYRIEEMPAMFDRLFGWVEPCDCLGKAKRNQHSKGSPGCFYYSSMAG